MTPLYIIPARGGSKGIPHKNIKDLCGRPLIAYTIDEAVEAWATLGGYIIVSTDDDAIAAAARDCGLDVDYKRPAHLAGDDVPTRDVILDAMAWAERRRLEYDTIILLQPTSPFRTAGDIIAAAMLYSPEVDMVVSVCQADANPYYNLFETAPNGTLHICKGDGLYTRRQEVPPVYEYNGAVYVINPASLRAMPMGAFPTRLPYLMPRERSIDLDTPEQWALAEMIMKNK